MDRKLARKDVGLSFRIVGELNHKQFKKADKDVLKEISNLKYIHNEIKSGKARRER